MAVAELIFFRSFRVGILVEQVARCNAHLATVVIQELCLTLVSSPGNDLHSLLALLEPFLRVAASLSSSGDAADTLALQIVACELVDATQVVVLANQRAIRAVLRFWEAASALDPVLVDLALKELLLRARTGVQEEIASIGEVSSLLMTSL